MTIVIIIKIHRAEYDDKKNIYYDIAAGSRNSKIKKFFLTYFIQEKIEKLSYNLFIRYDPYWVDYFYDFENLIVQSIPVFE